MNLQMKINKVKQSHSHSLSNKTCWAFGTEVH